MKTVGIALFDGFALPEIARIVETLQRANELALQSRRHDARFSVALMSTVGGRIVSSSSVYIWTESLVASRHLARFHALFVAGGPGVAQALRDEMLLGWLRRNASLAERVYPVGDGYRLLEAAGHGLHAAYAGASPTAVWRMPGFEMAGRVRAAGEIQPALELVDQALGSEAARQVAGAIATYAPKPFADIDHRDTGAHASEKLRASARWLEDNVHRQIGIGEAARIAAMSERNFLRKFKAEFGVTPSDYLLNLRLDMACRLLAQTSHSVDRIARRCGIGSGGALARLFRKHLGKTPSAYRAIHQPAGRAPAGHLRPSGNS